MRWSRLFALVALLGVPAGCGGGGAGTPGGAPGSGPTSAATHPPSKLTEYAVSSSPSRLGVTVIAGSATQSLTTPTTVVPVASNEQTTISIGPSNGALPYAVTVDQRADGKHAIFYNQAADTAGSLTVSQTASSARRRRTSREPVLDFPPQSSLGRPAYAAADVIVRYRAGAAPSVVERALGVTRALTLRTGSDGSQARVLDVPAGESLDAFARALRARPDVLSVERDALYHKQTATAVDPDDTHFDDYQQWDMFDIAAPSGWGYTEGSPAISIAMIDTGVDATSPDFANGKIAFAESIIAGTVTSGIAAVQDTDGHGTNTAGIAAADTNNGFGFAGTGFNVSLQIYKVFPDETAANHYASDARSSDVTRAIDEAVAHGARVVNLSLGTCQVEGVDAAQQDAIGAALAAGVVVVAAAGNERSGTSPDQACGGGSSTIDFPAAYDGVISVGATALNDSAAPMNPALATEYVAGYSNAGPGLTLVAPGGDPSAADESQAGAPDMLHWIYNLYTTTAANPQERCPNVNDCKALFAGTSQSTPHVSGAAALLLSKNPALGPAQVERILIATADDIGDVKQGHGRLDVARALAAVAGDPNPPAHPSAANFVAIAYVPNGTNRPAIVDLTYPNGAPVASNGTYRIAGVPATVSSFKIGVWYDANGDGLVDAGDYFGSSGTCTPLAPCPGVAAGIVASPVQSGFVLR